MNTINVMDVYYIGRTLSFRVKACNHQVGSFGTRYTEGIVESSEAVMVDQLSKMGFD